MGNSIDVFLLNKFQRISDWSQDWFGINNFKIAKLFWAITMLLLILQTVVSFLQKIDLLHIIVMLIVGSYIIILGVIFNNAEEICKNNPVFQNPQAVRLSPIRLFWFFMSAMCCLMLPSYIYHFIYIASTNNEQYKSLEFLFINIKDIALLFLMYFGSCTPKPYKPSKVKKLVEKAKEAIETVGEKISSPTPAFSVVRVK